MRVGVDVGGTKTLALALADDGTVLDVRVRPTVPGPRGVLDTAERAAAEVAGGARPRSVGVGIPGVVDGGTVRGAVNLGLDTLDLGAALAARTGVPVGVENDVKASALGAAERYCGPGGAGTLAYLNVGTGIGTAAVMDGRVLRGARGWAGELGHLVLDPDGDPCGCGQRGCLEAVAGGGALSRRLAALDPPAHLRDLCTAPALVAERDRVTAALVHLITATALAHDPDVLALGGGVPAHATGLVDRVLAALGAAAAGSPFLAGLALADRVRPVPEDWPVAALGAALVGADADPAAPPRTRAAQPAPA